MIQTITRRSLHKARSGLQALRAGIINRFSEDGSNDQNEANTFSLGRAEDGNESSSVTVTASIFDDATFGTQIFRTSTQPHPAGNDKNESHHPALSEHSYVPRSFATVPRLASKSQPRPCGNSVSTPGAKPTYATTDRRNLELRPSASGDLEAKTHIDDCTAHTTPSIDDLLRQSPGDVGLSAKAGNAVPPSDIAEPQSFWAGHWTANLHGSRISNTSSDTQTSDDKLSSLSLSRQCSAEVSFAFPGVYQEILEQCSRQPDDSNEPVPYPTQGCADGSGVVNSPNASPKPDECISLHECAHREILSSHEDEEGLIPLLPPQDPIPSFEMLQLSHHPNPLSFTHSRHSSDRWSSVSETSMLPWSRSDAYSSRYTTEELMSPDFGSSDMTSMTNDPWTPLETEFHFPSPIDEENGYFLVNGRASGRHPDQGNKPITPAQPIIIDCSIPIEDRPLNDLASPVILSPLSSNGFPGAPFDFEEDTDDDFYPGAAQLRSFR
ncbi:hypothetical protein N7535_004677 [Penicillium sp. DV-2018c]|nr:hypothetical protein N7461_008258 [Penicillium sp. DV-2018c]KAJ5571017.1 hypothetical protein N7535_004677 [Penicillium sp. DV-2018c]